MDRRALIVLALCMLLLGIGIGRAWAHTVEHHTSVATEVEGPSSVAALVARVDGQSHDVLTHTDRRRHHHPRGFKVPARWRLLADCESSGDWRDTAGFYAGGLQFAPRTWSSFHGTDFAPSADRASRREQVLVARRVLRRQGWAAWPSCSRALGWR